MYHNLVLGWRFRGAALFCGSLCYALCIIATIVSGLLPAFISSANAHFNLNVNIRIIHVDREDKGLRMFIRLPMAYLVADKLGPQKADGSRDPAPFTINKLEGGKLVHYLDPDALRSDFSGLGKIVTDGHIIEIDGTQIKGEFVNLRAYPALQQVPFAELEEARAAIKGEIYNADFEATYVGDTVIDAEIFYRTGSLIKSYNLRSTLNPGLPRQEDTANLLLDHFKQDTLTFRLRGLLSEPVEISRSAFKAFTTFAIEGARHILEGADHVLFVFCLVLGAATLNILIGWVTGFTMGHSITLTAGFFGYTPQGAWFAPLVETAIALSIIYAAIVAVSQKYSRGSFLTTTAIGFLHGLGFSFVLGKILKIDAPNLWQSLLAFNVGVEIGQIGIVLATWPILFLLGKRFPAKIINVRWVLATPCIAIASIWVGQRSLQLVSSL